MTGTLFLLSLTLTVLALAGALWTGRKGHRRAHYRWVVGTVLLLTWAIVMAEVYGRAFTFDPFRLTLHLVFAFSALASVAGVAYSGITLAMETKPRALHRRWVGLFLVLVVLSIASAGWMFLD